MQAVAAAGERLEDQKVVVFDHGGTIPEVVVSSNEQWFATSGHNGDRWQVGVRDFATGIYVLDLEYHPV